MEVQDNVKFGDLCEEAVQDLHKKVNPFEHCELVVSFINAHDKEKMCIASEGQLVPLELQTSTLMF
jgi:hypothetical protein